MRTQSTVFACVMALAAIGSADALSPRATDAYRQGSGEIAEGGSSDTGAVAKDTYKERQDAINTEATKKRGDAACDDKCKNETNDWTLKQRLDAVAEEVTTKKALAECNDPCKTKIDEWSAAEKTKIEKLHPELMERMAAIDKEAAEKKAVATCDDACKKEVDAWVIAEKAKAYEELMSKLKASGVAGVIGVVPPPPPSNGLGELAPGLLIEGTSNGLTEEEYKKIVEEIAKYNGKYAKELKERQEAIDKEAARRLADPNCDEKCKKLVELWAKSEKDKLAKEILAKIVKDNRTAIQESLKKKGIEKSDAEKMIDNYLKTIGKAKVKASSKDPKVKSSVVDNAATATNAGAAVVVASTVLAFMF